MIHSFQYSIYLFWRSTYFEIKLLTHKPTTVGKITLELQVAQFNSVPAAS